MNNEKRIIDIICDSLLPLAFLFLVIICIVISFSLPVHAASSDDYPLPYYVDYYQSSYFTDGFVLDSSLDFLYGYDMLWFGDIYDENSSYAWLYCYYPRPNTSFTFSLLNADLNNSVDYQNFNFSYDHVNISGSFIRRCLRLKKSEGVWKDAQVTTTNLNNTTISLLGRSSANINSYGFTSNVPYFLAENITFTDDDNNLIFTNGEPIIDNRIPGTATRPDKQERMDFLHNNRPDHVPEVPTSTSYTWITYNPPSIDTSTMETTLVSILDRLQYNFSYLFDNLGGLFSNLLSNFGSYFTYLGDLIAYGFDVVVNNIIAAIENFYDNMVSLVEPIFQKLEYITAPLDLNAVNIALQSTSFYQLISVANNLKSVFSDYFDSIPQPDSLVFNVPYSILTKSGVISVDFTWYAGVRSSVLPWIVGFLYAGFGLAIFRSIPSIIHGVSGVLQKGG